MLWFSMAVEYLKDGWGTLKRGKLAEKAVRLNTAGVPPPPKKTTYTALKGR